MELSINFILENPLICSVGVMSYSTDNISDVKLDFKLSLSTDLIAYVGLLSAYYSGSLLNNIRITGKIDVNSTV